MATTHFARTVHKSGGSGLAAGRIQYLTRTGLYSPAEARIRHQGLETGTERLREDLVHWEHQNLPAWSEGDAVRFFSAAETHERANGIAYEEWKFALPRELPRDHQLAAVRDVLQAAFGTQHPYIWALHDPPAADGGNQPHVHVLWSARTLDGIERPAAHFFTRYNRTHPERGGAEKARGLGHFGAVKAARVLYTDVLNLHLERAGRDERLHPDRLTVRGFDRPPEPRLAPSDSNARKYRQAITPAMQQVLDHRATRGPHTGAEQAQARTYWEERKQALGITPTLTHAHHLGLVRDARERTALHAPPQRSRSVLDAERHTLTQAIAGLERYHRTLVKEHVLEQAYARTGRCRSPASARDVERVLSEAPTHGLAVDPARRAVQRSLEQIVEQVQEEPQPGAALRVRIFGHDREHERDEGRDLGMGF
jgi:hypothetical protein